MLTPNYSKNDIIVLKLLSGEEIIGRYQSETDSSISVSKAFSVSAQQTQQGLSLGLTPALIIADPMQTIDIEKNAVAIRSRPPANHPIIAEYTQSTSGIAMPTTANARGLKLK